MSRPPPTLPSSTALPPAIESGIFSEIDREFTRWIARILPGTPPEVLLATALVSRARNEGHSCLDLRTVAGAELSGSVATTTTRLPALGQWRAALLGSPAVGAPGQFKPLILDPRGRLYLHRYWHYEKQLADAILDRAKPPPPLADATQSRLILDRLFPAGAQFTPGQRHAAIIAAERRLCVITGGPGTGKTHAVGCILALLLELCGGARPRIALCAPTGKAAARLLESILQFKTRLPPDQPGLDALPTESFTLHRLLGIHPFTNQPRYHPGNLLPHELIVVDEASMVDLSLMAKLFDAAPPAARIILLGDKDQLASVEAGAVLGDICHGAARAAGHAGSPLAECIIQLDCSHRFGERSGIRDLSRAVNEGNGDAVLQLLEHHDLGRPDLRGRPLSSPPERRQELVERSVAAFSGLASEPDPGRALRQLAAFRILCAIRRGPCGVESINQSLDQLFAGRQSGITHGLHYAGRPILICRNDPGIKLFNGDVGILLPDASSGALRAWFTDANGSVRSVPPARLPEHETAYAMTIHKSQGSEFDHVLIVLPDRDTPLLTRELLYTGITRARCSVEIWYEKETLRSSVGRQVARNSGLREALWPED